MNRIGEIHILFILSKYVIRRTKSAMQTAGEPARTTEGRVASLAGRGGGGDLGKDAACGSGRISRLHDRATDDQEVSAGLHSGCRGGNAFLVTDISSGRADSRGHKDWRRTNFFPEHLCLMH